MEANKLIAEFMGGIVEMYTEWNSGETWEICTLPKESNPLYMQNPNAYGIGVFKTEDFKRKNVNVHERCLQYHQSWDWLMPVVEKIERTSTDNTDNSDNFFNVMIEVFECNINGGDISICECGNTKREATYNAVVEYIKWYNEK